MIELVQSLAEYSLRAESIGLDYVYRGDRWRHRILVRTGDRWSVLAESVEGAPNDPTPPSPAFQDLRLEKPEDDVYEFQLFGQAGSGLFSAAVRFEGAAQSIMFDLCARQRGRGAGCCYGCTYAVASGGVKTTKPEWVFVHVSLDSAAVAFRPVTLGNPKPGEKPAATCSVRPGDIEAELVIAAVEPIGKSSDELRKQSIRWAYYLNPG